MLTPLNCIANYSMIGSLGVAADTASKGVWGWECEYACVSVTGERTGGKWMKIFRVYFQIEYVHWNKNYQY